MAINYINLHIGDFLGDTMQMSSAAVGAYFRLLMAHYKNGSKGIPKDPKKLKIISGCDTKTWNRIKDEVLEKFYEDGEWLKNKRVLKEVAKIDQKSGKDKSKDQGLSSRGKSTSASQLELSSEDNSLKNNETDERLTNNQYPIKKKEKSKPKKKISLDQLSLDHIDDWLAQKRVAGKYLTIDENRLLEKFKDYCRSKNKTYSDYVAAFRNAFEWDNAPTKGNHHGKRTRSSEADLATARALAKIQANSPAGEAELRPVPQLREGPGSLGNDDISLQRGLEPIPVAEN